VFTSLRSRLFFWILGGSGLLFLLTFWIIATFAHNNTRDQALAMVRAMGEAYAGQIEREFAHSYAVAESLALAVFTLHQQHPDRAVASAINAALLAANPQFIGLGSYWEPNAFDGRDAEFAGVAPENDATGRYLPYWNRAGGTVAVEPVADYETADWYNVPKQTGQPWATEPYAFPINGRPVWMVSLMVPIRDGGRFLGAVGADYPLQVLQERLATVRPFDAGQASLLSNEGVYASHPETSRLGQVAQELPEAARAAIKEGKDYTFVDDDQTMYLIRPVRPGQAPNTWALLLSFPLEAAMAKAHQITFLSAAIGAAGLVILALLIWPILSRLIRPLKRLAGTLSTWDGDVTQRLTLDRQDEIGVIGTAFNGFMTHLRELLQAIYAESRHLEATTHDLSHATDTVVQHSQQQIAAADRMGQEVGDMTRLVEEVAQQAGRLHELARDTGTVTTQATVTVSQTVDEIGQIDQTMQSVADGVKRLDERFQEITTIVNVIREIADQTNLLALNAAIEAARAGDQGRGFAVVADEVRQLATRTAQATGEIASTIARVQQGSSQAVRDVKRTSEQVNRGVALSREAASAIETIQLHAEDILGRVAAITYQATEQSETSQALARNIADMSTLAHDNDRHIHLARDQVQGLADLVETLHALVGRFRGLKTA
jgi:methyl-accepting chemotaxis protein